MPRTQYLAPPTLLFSQLQFKPFLGDSSQRKKNGADLELSRAAPPSYAAFSKLRLLSAELGDVLGRWAFLALHDVEFNALALSQRLEAVALNGGMMNEAILLSVLGGDEAKALGVVEPLYFAGGTHVRYILIQLCRSAVFAVPVRLLFVRGRNGRICSPKPKKDLEASQVPLKFAGSNAQS